METGHLRLGTHSSRKSPQPRNTKRMPSSCPKERPREAVRPSSHGVTPGGLHFSVCIWYLQSLLVITSFLFTCFSFRHQRKASLQMNQFQAIVFSDYKSNDTKKSLFSVDRIFMQQDRLSDCLNTAYILHSQSNSNLYLPTC